MTYGKWIGGFLGFMHGGPLTALWGFFIGSVYDALTSPRRRVYVHFQYGPPPGSEPPPRVAPLEDDYRRLGVAPTSTDDEVRRAYRQRAMECHPDRVAQESESVRRAAEKRFKEINEAKERIFKARGMK